MNKFPDISNIYEKLRQCPYCCSVNFHILYQAPDRYGGKPGIFYLSRCSNCGLAFQNPRIKQEYIHEYYSDTLSYYQTKSEVSISTLKKVVSYTVDNFFNIIQYSRSKKINLIPKFVKNGKLLEIGCSNGKQLEYFKTLGWDVCGIEMNKKAAAYAKNVRKLNVNNFTIENANYPNSTFDTIIMGMVIEHIYDPFELLKKIANWLKPGGKLLFSTPNFNSFEFRIFKKYTYALHLPNHIYIFNKKILKELLKKNSFKNIQFYCHSFERDTVASSNYKYRATKKPLYKIIAKSFLLKKFIIKPCLFLLSFLSLTSRFSVIATKK
ncbi:MAG: methyltransferase type 12 [uncultured bacterium]|nr:MAG: methyltransferase type 12 [uncultured bacterium]